MNSAAADPDQTWLIDAVLCLSLCGIVILLFFPGLMTNDSILQLAQAQSHIYEDAHPPLMSFLWQGFNHFYFGPAGMLVFHTTMFFLGLFLLVTAQPWPVYFRVSVILLVTGWPAIFTQLGVIWKDVGLSASFLLGCGLLANRRRYPIVAMAAVGLFFYGIGIRHNAWPAALPLLYIVVWNWTAPPKQGIKTIGAACVLCGFLLGLQGMITSHLVSQRAHFGQAVLLHDLTAISAWTGASVVPAQFLRPGKGIHDLENAYRPGNADPLRPVLLFSRDERSLSFLEKTWFAQILRHPDIYLKHRWMGFKRLVGLSHEEVHYPFESTTWPNPWNFRYEPDAFMKTIFQVIGRWQNTFCFRGWFYLAVNAAALLVAGVRCGNRFSFCVSLSGLMYGSGYAVYGVGLDFRYFYWTVLSGFVAWILLFNPDENARRIRTSPPKV